MAARRKTTPAKTTPDPAGRLVMVVKHPRRRVAEYRELEDGTTVRTVRALADGEDYPVVESAPAAAPDGDDGDQGDGADGDQGGAA